MDYFAWLRNILRVTKSWLYESRFSDHVIVHLGLDVSSSVHNCGCVVDGGNAMAAILILLTLGAHARSEGYCSCPVCFCVCVCVCVCS